MRAAEKLIAAKGIENVTIRQIVGAAGQKNESALQYHFKNREGLINALRKERTAELRDRRAAMLKALLHENPQPSLRQVAGVMVRPVFELARKKPEFRRYVRAFGQELALAETSALAMARQGEAGGENGGQIRSVAAGPPVSSGRDRLSAPHGRCVAADRRRHVSPCPTEERLQGSSGGSFLPRPARRAGRPAERARIGRDQGNQPRTQRYWTEFCGDRRARSTTSLPPSTGALTSREQDSCWANLGVVQQAPGSPNSVGRWVLAHPWS